MNVMLACLSFSMLAVLLDRGIERQYAIELIADAAWKVYEKWAILPRFLARLFVRDPVDRMKSCVNTFLRFPFNPPGYTLERTPSDCGIRFNVLRCPVALYLQRLDAGDLCVASWCNLDFPLAEIWGGKLKRTGTLAGGSDHCDFHFTVRPDRRIAAPIPRGSHDNGK
jgi:ubiquinone biosynthesis protein